MHVFEHNPSSLLNIIRALFYPRQSLKATEQLPRLSAKRIQVKIDTYHLARYCDVCGITFSNKLPILYPHVIAAPLHMWLITHPTFPLRLLGAVHLRNHIIQQRPIDITETVSITCCITTERRTEKGIEFDFTTVLHNNSEIVWEGLTTYFVRGKFGKADPESTLTHLEKIPNSQTLKKWHIHERIAKRYAVITQDYNPIHLSKWLAKLFGFQRDLAHGFCVLAKSLNEAKIFPPINANTAQRLDVLFKGPTYLDSHVVLKQKDNRFDLFCDGDDRPCIEFKIEDIPTQLFLTVENKKLQQG